MVSTAAQAPPLSGDTVGSFSAGRILRRLSSFLQGTFIFNPTFSSAAMAPSKSITISFIFSFLPGFFHDPRLAMNLVFDSMTVSSILSLLARNELPVSVTSTIASASSGGLASVAPQLNSTSAFTPCFFKYFLVMFTTSVATRLPCRSFTDFIFPPSGAASTQRTGLMLCLL